MKKIFLLILLLPLLFGCKQSLQDAVDIGTGASSIEKKIEADKKMAKVECIKLCQIELGAGVDLSNGPCLANPMISFPDWVCDVAHNPRKAVDGKSENQCSAYRNRKANHFIEVDEDCNFIRAF